MAVAGQLYFLLSQKKHPQLSQQQGKFQSNKYMGFFIGGIEVEA
jgi:hypothetical protein